MFGVDDAAMGYAAMAAATAASGAMAYRANQNANQANQLINSHNQEQAWDMYHGTMAYNTREAEVGRAYNSAEAVAARDFSAAEALKGRDFSSLESQKSRDFSERMSSTSYQRAVQDLKLAGLNPMLAYSQGGSSTPSSAMASAPTASTSQASSGSASSSGGQVGQKIAMQSAMSGVQSNLLQSAGSIAESFARAKAADAQAEKTKAETPGAGAESDYKVRSLDTRVMRNLFAGLSESIDLDKKEQFIALEREAYEAEQKFRIKDLGADGLQAKRKEIENKIRSLDVPKAEAYADYYRSLWGKSEPYVRLGVEATEGLENLMSSATSLGRYKEMARAGAWNRSKGRNYSETIYDRHGDVSGGRSRSYQDD